MSPRPPLRIVALISGKGSNLQSIIDHINRGELNARITAVISDKTDAQGLERARDHDIPVITVTARKGESRQDYDRRLADAINEHKPDLVVCAGFMRIFSDQLVELFHGRMLNIHPSLLPKHKGLNTHSRALESGDEEHGASVHFVTPELDGGPAIMQATVPVKANDDEQLLAARVLQQEHILYPAVIKLFADNRLELCGERIKLDGQLLEQPLQIGEQ